MKQREQAPETKERTRDKTTDGLGRNPILEGVA
jgi:hypothetical protein